MCAYVRVRVRVLVRACVRVPLDTRTAHYNDIYRFDPANAMWTALPPSGDPPLPRNAMGFAATPDGMLYVFGGYSSDREGRDGRGVWRLEEATGPMGRTWA